MKRALSDERVRTEVAYWLSFAPTDMLNVLDTWASAGLHQPAGQMSYASVDERIPDWLVHAVRTADAWSADSFADKALYPFRPEAGAMRAMQTAHLKPYASNGYMSSFFHSLAGDLRRQVRHGVARRLHVLPAATASGEPRMRL